MFKCIIIVKLFYSLKISFIGRNDLTINTEALNIDSWMDTNFPYWEGPISFSGDLSGVGYLEMTGY